MCRMARAKWWAWFALLLCLPFMAQARGESPAQEGMRSIAVASLPNEARETLHHILHGGPFPYARDGVVFGNHEHRLPSQPHGYYHEYTVKTPGAHNRGPRRIVCGPLPECYYTADHYRTFLRIED